MSLRIAYRPLVEALENRLQPGSMVPLAEYGWSPAINVASAISDPASQGEVSGPPSSNLFDDLAGTLTGDELANASLKNQRGSPSLAAATPALEQPVLLVPAGSLLQSPIGVAAPATAVASTLVKAPLTASPAAPAQPASGIFAVPARLVPLDSAVILRSGGFRVTDGSHAVPLVLGNGPSRGGGNAGNQATVNFLSYLGGLGPASINSIAVRKENGANFIYVAGAFTDGTGRANAFAAKLTDGATTVVWATGISIGTTPGPDRALGIALNDKSVYVSGSFTDPTANTQVDGFVAQLEAATGSISSIGVLPDTPLAAVATDPSGNLYAAGSVPDPVNANQQDVDLVKSTGDLTTTIYDAIIRYQTFAGALANSAVFSAGGLAVDAQGNVYFAGTAGVMNDPNNDMEPLVGWLNDASGPTLYATVGVANPSPGPRGGSTGVAFDPSGNVVFTGNLNDNGTGLIHGNPGLLHQDLILGRLQPSFLPLVDPVTGDITGYQPTLVPVDAITWYVDDRTPAHNRAGDWTGNQLVVLPDSSTVVTGAAYDPAAPRNPPLSMPTNGIDVHLTHFLAGDNATPTADLSNADPENVFGGSGADMGNAVALDPSKATNVYVVGSTTSADLPTTPGAVQQTWGGGSTTGFVGQASVP